MMTAYWYTISMMDFLTCTVQSKLENIRLILQIVVVEDQAASEEVPEAEEVELSSFTPY
jgi:hypothetical protein